MYYMNNVKHVAYNIIDMLFILCLIPSHRMHHLLLK